ncbi:MAG: chemotaxis protein CheD [Candidatus Saccharibacteria bacterium]
MVVLVGIGDYAVSDQVDDIIKTYALGSCVAVTAYYPVTRVLGMVHIALPDSTITPEDKRSRPGYFADTGIDALLKTMCVDYNCNKAYLQLKLYGGAESVSPSDNFNVGKRNLEAIAGRLTGYNMRFDDSETGGTVSRTIEVPVSSGVARITYGRITI